MISQGLRGFVGQGMDGRKKRPEPPAPFIFPAPPPVQGVDGSQASYTWAPPISGRWKFVLWGGGAGASSGAGASGAYAEITSVVSVGQRVSIKVGSASYDTPTAAAASTVTFPDGKVVTAGGASGVTPGAATGGDINVAGSAPGAAGLGTGGGAAGAGAGAPAMLPFRGGAGGAAAAASSAGASPGGGAAYNGIRAPGGNGLAAIFFVN